MFSYLFTFINRWPKAVLALAVVLLVGAGLYGSGVFSYLSSENGFNIRGTESYQVAQDISDHFNQSEPSGIILFESTNPTIKVTDPQFMSEVESIISSFSPKPISIASFYTTNQAQFLSTDKTKTYAAVTFEGTIDQQIAALNRIQQTASTAQVMVETGGQILTEHQSTTQVEQDLKNAEIISLPILAILLLLFFRSPIAAALPVLLGIISIVGALGVVRVLTHFFDIDQYSVNVITILGLGLAVDYSLLMVNRFKEELRAELDTSTALRKAYMTSGRTILFSGVTVMTCLLVLSIFPIGFLRSVGLGGSSALLVAIMAAMVILPALLSVIGPNINRWTIGRKSSSIRETHSIWLKTGAWTLRHPIFTLAISGLLILSVAYPFTHIHFASLDYKSLAERTSSYKVAASLANDFAGQEPPIDVIYQLDNPTSADGIADLYHLTQSLTQLSGVGPVESPLPTDQPITLAQYQAMYQSGHLPAGLIELKQMRISKNLVHLTVHPENRLTATQQNALVDSIRNTSVSGGHILVGGEWAVMNDTLRIIGYYLPWALGIMALAIFILFTLLLQSIVIPLKTIIINAFTLLATFGIMTLVFQDGWLTQHTWLNQTGGIQPSIPVLVFSVAFGLSMDYAAFLYGRMHEEYVKTKDNDQAVLVSLDKTGGIITAAAVLLFVVVAAFATSQVAVIQQVGLGLAAAVILDAFVIRMFLVPAIMKLLGDFNWYAPAWLKLREIRHT